VSELPLIGERVTVDALAESDLAAFVAYRQVPEIARWQSWETDYSLEQARTLVATQQGWTTPPAGEWMQLAVRSADGTLLGDVALHQVADQPDSYEIGFTLAPAYHGVGYATEAVALLLHHVFTDLGAHRVFASLDARNLASAAVLRRVGMRHESHQVEADWFKDEWTTLDGYALLSSEYSPRT
jgi:RimJ/RimL family protein N-acetyltransferase